MSMQTLAQFPEAAFHPNATTGEAAVSRHGHAIQAPPALPGEALEETIFGTWRHARETHAPT